MALANGAARELPLHVNSFEPGPTFAVERLQQGCTSQILLKAGKSGPGTQVAKAPVKSGIKVKVDSGQRNGGSISCPPGLERITPNPFWNIAQEGTGMSRSQVLRHANQSRTQEKQELGHPLEPFSSRKDFLDEALLIGYDGSNMPNVMFKNQIMNLMERCPYPDRKLPLLHAACVRAAAHTNAVVISDTPGFDDEAKISMAFDWLLQRFGARGGFVNEPEIRHIRNGPKMTFTSAAAWKTFKDELTQCFVFAHSYKKPELLEGRLVVDLSCRFPTHAKQRFWHFLSDRFGSTGDPTFASLLQFVEREEESKSSDFGVQLMADERSERTSKPSAKSSGNPSFKVKKTSAQFDSNGRRNNDGNFQNSNMISARAKPYSDSKSNDLVSVAPQCFVCVMERLDSHRKVANCQRFRRMNPSERKDVVF